jgi:ornithine carbamoyltransferase
MTSTMVGRDLLSIADLSEAEISTVINVAKHAKRGGQLGTPLLGRSIAMIFQRPSNRTRVSFEVAVNRLGGHAIALFNPEVQLGERESAADISRILDRYVDGIVARLVSHRDLIAIADAAESPVVNALTDYEHPCQVLADCMTVHELLGRLHGARVTYIGDGNNVCTSWIYAAALCSIDLRIVCPRGYEPQSAVLDRARRMRDSLSLQIEHEPDASLRDADVIYTDVWASMGQENERERRRQDFRLLQVNDSLLAKAPRSARVMHCLPAHRGEEITDSVIDGPQSIVFEQAENRKWVQMALLALIYGHGYERGAAGLETIDSGGTSGVDGSELASDLSSPAHPSADRPAPAARPAAPVATHR